MQQVLCVFAHLQHRPGSRESEKKRPQTALGALFGASEKHFRFSKLSPRRPRRPPNEVGRRLEEETPKSRFVQHLFANITILEVGRALDARLDT